jgi:hypothetical protein
LAERSTCQKSNQTSPDAAQKQRNTPREKRQKEAAIMNASHTARLKDGTKHHLFLAKYLGILLIKDGVTRIVTAATFSNARSIWLLTATTVKQDKYDDRIYIADPDRMLPITIDVSITRPGLATYIKDFNSLENPLI